MTFGEGSREPAYMADLVYLRSIPADEMSEFRKWQAEKRSSGPDETDGDGGGQPVGEYPMYW